MKSFFDILYFFFEILGKFLQVRGEFVAFNFIAAQNTSYSNLGCLLVVSSSTNLNYLGECLSVFCFPYVRYGNFLQERIHFRTSKLGK